MKQREQGRQWQNSSFELGDVQGNVFNINDVKDSDFLSQRVKLKQIFTPVYY